QPPPRPQRPIVAAVREGGVEQARGARRCPPDLQARAGGADAVAIIPRTEGSPPGHAPQLGSRQAPERPWMRPDQSDVLKRADVRFEIASRECFVRDLGRRALDRL